MFLLLYHYFSQTLNFSNFTKQKVYMNIYECILYIIIYVYIYLYIFIYILMKNFLPGIIET